MGSQLALPGTDARLGRRIRAWCARHEIPLVGFAPADRWDGPLFEPWVPEPFRPKAIWPEAKSVIVLGLPVSLPVLETAPSIWYHDLYKTVNALLDGYGYRLSVFLSGQGHASVWVPRDGYDSIRTLQERPVAFFSHRHAALLAGLGNFGTSGMLLTPEFGPRVRFVSVFTDAILPPDPVIADPLCTRCMRCTRECPVQALPEGEYPSELTDKPACAGRSADLHEQAVAPCGRCLAVCPAGEDRILFSRGDPRIYNGTLPEGGRYRAAWDHVRSYGVRKPKR